MVAISLRRFSYLYRQFGEHSVSDNVVVSVLLPPADYTVHRTSR